MNKLYISTVSLRYHTHQNLIVWVNGLGSRAIFKLRDTYIYIAYGVQGLMRGIGEHFRRYAQWINRISGSRISFRGGGSKFFWKSGGICMHGASRHAARGEATCFLRGFGGMPPRENF